MGRCRLFRRKHSREVLGKAASFGTLKLTKKAVPCSRLGGAPERAAVPPHTFSSRRLAGGERRCGCATAPSRSSEPTAFQRVPAFTPLTWSSRDPPLLSSSSSLRIRKEAEVHQRSRQDRGLGNSKKPV